MAFKDLLTSLRNLSGVHTPTLALLIGTVMWWLELYVIRLPYGYTSWTAWILLILVLGWMAYLKRTAVLCTLDEYSQRWQEQPLRIKGAMVLIGSLVLAYLSIGLYASLLPPHLTQEYDALNYHLTLPRQHLIRHSFAHLAWSTADLYLLPLDYALSPFWLASVWPNKFIQFFFFIAALGGVYQIVMILSKQSRIRAAVGVLAVMACHAVAIQVGTAMLDLVMVYCFLAFVHSLLSRRWGWAVIEFTFFAWSKSFIAPQILVIGLVLGMIVLIATKMRWGLDEMPLHEMPWRKMAIIFFITSTIIAGPQLIKSTYYSGSPLYPFAARLLPIKAEYPPDYQEAMRQRAAQCVETKDMYGHGRSWGDLIRHWWLLAVPEKGVNNAFDYPLGLIYLLVLLPFGWNLVHTLRQRRLPVLSVMVVLWWISWWFGSQQSRFLLIPVCFMVMLAISYLPRLTKTLIALIVITLSLELISLANAHRSDWGKPYTAVIRAKDIKLANTAPDTGSTVIQWDSPDVAFSPWLVDVRPSDSVFVIPYSSTATSR